MEDNVSSLISLKDMTKAKGPAGGCNVHRDAAQQ